MTSRSFSIIIVFITLSIVGCALLPLLPVKLAPSRSLPSVSVRFNMPGNSAETVEKEVTSRIESVLARISGVKDIDSKSYNGRGRVSVSFDRHTDIEMARFEAAALLRQIWSELPDGVSYPEITPTAVFDENTGPFMTYRLNAPGNPSEIQVFGEEKLKPVIARIPGVYKIQFSGALPMEWRISYDTDKLTALGFSPYDIQKAVSEHYSKEFLGSAMTSGDNSEYIRLLMHPDSRPEEFDPQKITVKGTGGVSLPLDKLVSVEHTESVPESFFRINGLNSIYVSITSDENANQLALSEQIRDAVSRFEASMPQGYEIEVAYDATETIRKELDKIYFRTGLTVLILLLFVGLVTLSMRYVLLITIGLSINLAVAAVFYYLTDIEIQLYSLAGITISLNLIIDNLIVMTDHYTRCHNRSVFTSVLAATLTTIGALSIVFFMDESTRLSLEDFVTVVIINLTVSLAVALFLVPALVDRLGIRKRRAKIPRLRNIRRRVSLALTRVYAAIVRFVVRFRVAVVLLVILAFGLPVFMLPEKIEGEGYWTEKYNSVFGSPTYKEKVKPYVDVMLGGTLRLFVKKVYDGFYWNRDDSEPTLYVNATLPNGSTLTQMDVLVRKMEAFLSGYSEISQFQASVSGARRASIVVYFKKAYQHDGTPYRIKNDIISKALTLGGGSWGVYGLEDQGFNNDVRQSAGNYQIVMTGYNYDELSDWAYRMRDSLTTNRRINEVTVASEYSYYKDDYTEFHIALDRERLAKYGISTSQLFNAIRPTFGRKIQCGYVSADRTAESIMLYSVQSDMYDIFSLLHQPFTVGDKTFNLTDLGSIEKRQAPKDIVKKNQEYVMTLQYEYIGSYTQGEKTLKQAIGKMNSILPVGYTVRDGRRSWSYGDQKSNYWLILLVIAIIFLTTTILFNSLKQPLAIIFIIPASFIGVFSVFYLFGLKFDKGGFASFILLAGITVNAAIYILNEYNTLRKLHPESRSEKLYMRAFQIKIVPILLTVLSTILGFIPFIIGTGKESFWFPLAAGTMGGLAVSLIAILFVLPTLALPKRKKENR